MSSSGVSNLFSRASIETPTLVGGKGIYIWDSTGKRYIDGSGGPLCVNIGYGVKEVNDAIARQMRAISFAYGGFFVGEAVKECAAKVASFAPGSLKHVFFCSGGSEATEAAAKMARQFHLESGEKTRYKVVARWQSYHGNTLGALSMSGNIARRRRFTPMLIDYPHIPPAYCYRCWFGKTRDACDLECARSLDTAIKAAGPEYVSAFIAEPVVGATLGTVPAPEGYFQLIREICDDHGVLFIADEVMTGFGRTGKRWGIDHWGVEPDIITAAKGIASGYLPLGATIASDKVFEGFSGPFAHGHTYGNHPLCCAAGAACLDYIEKHKLVERSAELGPYLLKKLKALYDHPTVGDVRGLGIFAGIEFVKDKETKEPLPANARFNGRVFNSCMGRGLLIYPGSGSLDGSRGDHIQVGPPLVVKKSEIDEIVKLLDEGISEAESQVL
jgi:adenosylmethionine-8-amino-7-oxononanoate aminotransferase